MDEIAPREVGKVSSLIGAPFRADVEFPRDDEQLAGFDIELVGGRKGGRSKAWRKPAWSYSSDEPRFVSVDDRRAFGGMLIDSRRPVVQMQVTQPIDAYSWVLRQDGDVIDEGTEVTDDISDDGLTFEFRPDRRLRRSGRPGRARRKGVFYPPFDSHLPDMPRTEDSRIRYTALTHPGHDEHDAFAVDFNWGSGGTDKGHWVRSAAAGRVTRVDPADGLVHISHPKFDGESTYETVYAHLDPVLVEPHEWVRTQQRIGRIGARYHGGQPISPHLHHQHRKDGEPVRMKLLIHGRETPIAVSQKDPERTLAWDTKVPGWTQPRGPAPGRFSVRTRGAADQDWSRQSNLRFDVAARDAGVPEEQEALFDKSTPWADVARDYDGPDVEPGNYTVRYRARGDAGTETPWAYDQSIVVEPALA